MNPIAMTASPASTAFKAHGYDPATQTLALTFASGHTYHFPEVSVDVADSRLHADSLGRWYQENIKNRYKGVLFVPEKTDADETTVSGDERAA